jgi:hypothetical protein
MVTEKDWVAVIELAMSVTWTVKVVVPEVVGVPLIVAVRSVLPLRESPGGSEPDEIAQV